MKPSMMHSFALLLLLLFLSHAQTGACLKRGEVILCFNFSAIDTGDELKELSAEGCGIKEYSEELNCALVQVDDVEHFISEMKRRRGIAAEPNYIVSAFFTPNDPYYDRQWGLHAIYASDAWDCGIGEDHVKIAIIDTGIDYNHEDLNNYVSGGYDWVNDDDDPMDDNGHGTHCAGIAAAVMDNSKGIAGVAQVSIMAEKVLNESGYGNVYNVSEAIVHAADLGADVISMSLGTKSYSTMLERACEYAHQKGCILVAAAGNDGTDRIYYPAAYESVIAVGALSTADMRANFSNYGAQMEIVAPGKNILSTYLSNRYAYMSGTSMATPFVAGVAALVWSANPSLSNQDVRSILQKTAIDLGATGWDEYYGYGKLNASAAVCSQPPVASFSFYPKHPAPNITVIFNASSSYDPDDDEITFRWDFGDGTSAHGEVVSHRYASSGIYKVVLTVEDKKGMENATYALISVCENELSTGESAQPYPSIAGTHFGRIKPNRTITVRNLSIYPCAGTGGHAEYVRIWSDHVNVSAIWRGYGSNITFDDFVMKENETYYYEIRTGSYPQMIHRRTFSNAHMAIECINFTDVNGRRYDDWIPAMRLW